MRVKNAAPDCRVVGAAGATQRPPYHHARPPVNRPRRIFPGWTDWRPSVPPTPTPRQAASVDGTLVGLLLLLLCASGNNLTTRQSRAAWGVAQRWTAEYVAVRHEQESRDSYQ